METIDGKPCEIEVDVASAFCSAGHLCVSPPDNQAPRAPTAASSDLRPVEDILAVSGGGTDRLVMMSPSAADDGGFVAMADVTRAAGLADLGDDYRLLGGIAVMLHIQRLGIDVPLRRTGDADFGVPPLVLKSGRLVEELEAMGYRKTSGCTWERVLDERRTASTDLLIPAYTSRPRVNKEIDSNGTKVVTTEVPGLAEALRRAPVQLPVRFVLSHGRAIETEVLLPDAVGMLLLKAGARKVRNEERDSTDLWRCLEVATAEGVTPADLPADPVIGDLGAFLRQQLGRRGPSITAITKELTPAAAGRLETRIQAMLLKVTGS
ncbi:MAG: hypothetical protein ACLQNG_02235 [Acidimicrobiales bacterium]